MASERILLVDDDTDMQMVLKLYLEKSGYVIFTAEDGIQAIAVIEDKNPELIILDVMMPNLDGFELLPIIRKHTDVPVLLFSSIDDDMNKVLGLGIGADDYLPKTTSMPVMIAKIKAHLRRSRAVEAKVRPVEKANSAIISYPGLEINLTSAVVKVNGSIVKLSAKEYQLLCILAQNPERIYTVDKLFELIWGEESLGDFRTVMVHLSKLRKKIEKNPDEPQYIHTLRGIGYKFADLAH
ncbi:MULTISPECIES: response regulator transcription factor [Oceanobacillus]|uniref:response regulator transcription factor n=1 Tax=Oceanobacillus TaxID=182709 RepID=UPI00203D18FC|nr:response regulator transcription factor [Oceanobacillus profundus]MCM3399336.1 response regulator transcription factor [Oceanobacillus profundus]